MSKKQKVEQVTEPSYLSKQTLTNIADLPSRVSQFTVITTDEQLTLADQIDKQLKLTIEGTIAELAEGKERAHKAWKWFTVYEKEKTEPLIRARQFLSRLVAECLTTRQRIADEEARRKQVELAEQARLEAEAKRETQLEVLVNEGRDDEAAELIEEQLVVENVARVKVEPVKPVGLGMGLVSRWSCELVDIKKLCRAVADGVVEANCITMDQKYMDTQARARKATFDYPGVKVVETKGTSR